MRAPAASPASARARAVDLPRAAMLTLAHGVNDSYGNYVAILLPLLKDDLGFSLGLASAMVTANTITSGIIQPLLGYVADRWATRLMSVAGIVLSAAGASLLGLAPHYLILLLLAVLSGLGTAVYHPQAAAMVVAVSGERKATAMSVYLMGGNVGFALGPLIATALVDSHGLNATWLALAPGLVGALMLARFAPRDWSPAARAAGLPLRQIIRANRSVLGRLLAVVATRSWAHYSLMAFLPLYLQERGVSASERGWLVATITFVGAFGGLAGGYLADRWLSRRAVIVGSLLLSSGCILALLHTTGIAQWVWAALSGLTLLGSFAVLTVKGQEVMPQNVGLASGFMLGLTIALGGLFVLPMGAIADHTGLTPVIHLAVALPPLAALFALALPE